MIVELIKSASLRAGCNIDGSYTQQQIEHILNLADVEAVICTADQIPRLIAAKLQKPAAAAATSTGDAADSKAGGNARTASPARAAQQQQQQQATASVGCPQLKRIVHMDPVDAAVAKDAAKAGLQLFSFADVEAAGTRSGSGWQIGPNSNNCLQVGKCAIRQHSRAAAS